MKRTNNTFDSCCLKLFKVESENEKILEMNVADDCDNKYDDYDDYDYDDYDSGYEWTDEDAWDAMTDGMYGDYPGSGWDSEMFGY